MDPLDTVRQSHLIGQLSSFKYHFPFQRSILKEIDYWNMERSRLTVHIKEHIVKVDLTCENFSSQEFQIKKIYVAK